MKYTYYWPLFVFVAAALWASDAPFRSQLTSALPSYFIVMVEHIIATVLVLPILIHFRHKIFTISPKQWQSLLIIGIWWSALATVLFTQSFVYTNPSTAILIQKLQPFIVIAWGLILFKEKLSTYFAPCAILGICGAYLISFNWLAPQLFEWEQRNPHMLGLLCAWGAMILWAISTLAGKFIVGQISFWLTTALRFCIGCATLVIINIMMWTISILFHLTMTDWLYLFIISITSGIISLFVYYKGMKHTPVHIVTIAELSFPLMAVVINWITLGNILQATQILWASILLIVVWILSRSNTKNSNHSSSVMAS